MEENLEIPRVTLSSIFPLAHLLTNMEPVRRGFGQICHVLSVVTK